MKIIYKILIVIAIIVTFFAIRISMHNSIDIDTIKKNNNINLNLINWGFGIEPRQSINTLKIIKKLKSAFDTRVVTPPKPDNIFSYYYVMVTPSNKVSAIVGLSDYKSWNECIDTQNKLVNKMLPILGKPKTKENKGKFVKIFPIDIEDYGDIRVNCQPLNLPNVKARLMKIYNPSDELLNETFSKNQKKLKEIQGKLKNNESIFLKK